MSLIITLQCPVHPMYAGKVRPGNGCSDCRLIFDVRNNTHKIISTPIEERTDSDERIIASIT